MRSPVRLLLIVSALALVSTGVLYAQDTGVPDTVYFGDNGTAFGIGGGAYKIPIYVASDQTLKAVQPGMVFGLLNPAVVFDSVSTVFASPETWTAFDLFNFKAYNRDSDGSLPDTIGLAAIGYHNDLAPGRYKLGDAFFHGANIGDFVEVDSAWHAPGNGFVLVSPAPADEFTPIFVGGVLEIVETGGEFFVLSPTQVSGDAGYPIALMVDVVSGLGIAGAVLDSIIQVSTGTQIDPGSLPPVLGANPFQAVWTPNPLQYGTWNAYFRIFDNVSNELEVTINVTVQALPSACDIIRGDPNCDGFVSIGDAVFIINFIFGGGPGPQCQ